MPDGTQLIIFHSVCSGSADGDCQAVDVFQAGKLRAIWHKQYATTLAVHALPDGFSVKAVTYAPSDPLCCSSLPPVVDVYRWKRSHFVESGPLPKDPGS